MPSASRTFARRAWSWATRSSTRGSQAAETGRRPPTSLPGMDRTREPVNRKDNLMRSLSPPAPGLLLSLALLTSARSALGGAEAIGVPGVIEPVEILTDRWGVAPISAHNEHDLFFAQGFNVARDRLFQLELWRRQATGTAAEVLGKKALPHDTGTRLLKYRGDMTRELNRYHPRGAEIVRAFVAGVNAYIARTEDDPTLLPVEFKVLGITPGHWTPEVVVSRHNGLYRNLTGEVQHARLVRTAGPEK